MKPALQAVNSQWEACAGVPAVFTVSPVLLIHGGRKQLGCAAEICVCWETSWWKGTFGWGGVTLTVWMRGPVCLVSELHLSVRVLSGAKDFCLFTLKTASSDAGGEYDLYLKLCK